MIHHSSALYAELAMRIDRRALARVWSAGATASQTRRDGGARVADRLPSIDSSHVVPLGRTRLETGRCGSCRITDYHVGVDDPIAGLRLQSPKSIQQQFRRVSRHLGQWLANRR